MAFIDPTPHDLWIRVIANFPRRTLYSAAPPQARVSAVPAKETRKCYRRTGDCLYWVDNLLIAPGRRIGLL
ncbi:jg24602 [Pararge aegeria aegeria]|uniref:Jg24602 protein n=1 Tax=Pararge aegeria aegeria TaxID=348720 RepID=A0A8S4QVE5_9NEOP|nr:jg24602 [Pararge aegeria aegeria]